MEHVIIKGIGNRATNQDECVPKDSTPNSSIYLVCDGVGGLKDGDLAAKITSEAIFLYLNKHAHCYSKKAVLEAIIYSEYALDSFKEKYNKGHQMSTTLSMLTFHSSTQATAYWIGDSRVYHIRNSEILFQSTDHSLSEYFYQRGLITSNAREHYKDHNVITKCLSGRKNAETPDFHHFYDIKPNDYFLISSDGFHEVLTSHHFNLFQSSTDIKLIEQTLHVQCLTHSQDNYSCHIIKV